jgi:hypothetical protein
MAVQRHAEPDDLRPATRLSSWRDARSCRIACVARARFMHATEFLLALSRPCRRSPRSLSYRSGGESDRRLGAPDSRSDLLVWQRADYRTWASGAGRIAAALGMAFGLVSGQRSGLAAPLPPCRWQATASDPVLRVLSQERWAIVNSQQCQRHLKTGFQASATAVITAARHCLIP